MRAPRRDRGMTGDETDLGRGVGRGLGVVRGAGKAGGRG